MTTPWRTHFETVCTRTLQDHPRSMILAPIESAYETLEILQLFCSPKATFSISHPYSGQNFGVFPLE